MEKISETATYGTGQFKNVYTDQIVTPVINDYELKGSVGWNKEYDGSDYVPIEEIDDPNTILIKVYLRDELPPKNDRYLTSMGMAHFFLKEEDDEDDSPDYSFYASADRGIGMNGVEWWMKEIILTEEDFKKVKSIIESTL